ncbi:MAG: hypothetical protein LBB09_02760 [Rickettsiales bacterium]|jgi:dihydroorotate dehydrogenase electron transfer subunit|nr:hypothetical protein [Rickettsiales bacterium]
MQKTVKIWDAGVVWRRSYGSSFLLVLSLQEKMSAEPGQYIFMRCGELALRRAISIADLIGDRLIIFIKKKGGGTEYLSKLKSGDRVDFIGPLGKGFSLEKKKSLLIGAGAGIAPVFFAKNFLKKQGIDSLLVGGFNTKDAIPDEFELDECATADGSRGLRGRILDCLPKIAEEYAPEIICACGPEAVLRGIADFGLERKIKTELSLEREMACGFGVCRGCAVKIRRDGEIVNASVCRDGPVFKGEDVIW